MIDKLTEEPPIIQQHISNKIQALIVSPVRVEVVRLPLQVYLFCRHIFKRQEEVLRYILSLFTTELYLKDVGKEMKDAEQMQAQEIRPYLRMLLCSKDIITVLLAQLVVRFCILGLAIKAQQPWKETVSLKTKKIVQDLQVELALEGGSFGELMVKELQVLSEEFGSLEFYEGLREVFSKCDTFHVQEWIESAIQHRRQEFLKKQRVTLDPKHASKQTRKIIKPKRVTISSNCLDSQKVLTTTQSNTRLVECRERKENKENDDKEEKKLPSVSAIASQMRASGGSLPKSQPKLPHRLIHRSNKKISSQEQTITEVYFEETNPLSRESPKKVQSYHKVTIQTHAVVVDSSPIDKILCLQTPPRVTKRKAE